MKKTLVTALTLAMAAPMVFSSVANAEKITMRIMENAAEADSILKATQYAVNQFNETNEYNVTLEG